MPLTHHIINHLQYMISYQLLAFTSKTFIYVINYQMYKHVYLKELLEAISIIVSVSSSPLIVPSNRPL